MVTEVELLEAMAPLPNIKTLSLFPRLLSCVKGPGFGETSIQMVRSITVSEFGRMRLLCPCFVHTACGTRVVAEET